MKKVLLVLGLVVLMLLAYGCGKKPPPPPPEVPVAVPTAPPPTPPTPPPPPPPPPEIIESDFQVVYFDLDKYNIRPDQKMILDKNAQILLANPNISIKLEGHCDERGTVEYNLALGDKRAVAVKGYLVDMGINANHIETISYGKERPVDPLHNEEAWAKNRRSIFRITKK